MSINCVYKDITLCQCEFFKAEDCAVDASLIVPDKNCDIMKVISVRAIPVATETRVSNGSVTISGQVKFNILYIGEDESSKICTLNTSAPFSHSMPVQISDNSIPTAEVTACASEYTLPNSRKIRLLSRLKLSLTVFNPKKMKVLTSCDDAQTIKKDHSYFSASGISVKNIPITQTVDLPASKSEMKEILKSDASISDFDYKVLNNKAIVKGNILISLLYLSEDSTSTASVTLPFTEVFEAEGLSPKCENNISLTVSDWDITRDTDLSGEYKMIEANLILTALVTSLCEENVTSVSDMFLPGCRVETTSDSVLVQSSLKRICEEEFVKEAVSLNFSEGSIERILDISLSVTDLGYNEEANLITASLEATVLYINALSPSTICSYSTKLTVPHRAAMGALRNICVTVPNAGFAIRGENSIELRFTALFTAYSLEEEKVNFITECEERDYTPERRSSVIVSFINQPDTLWNVAKKYNIPVSSLASANALEENAPLLKGTKLIIPK